MGPSKHFALNGPHARVGGTVNTSRVVKKEIKGETGYISGGQKSPEKEAKEKSHVMDDLQQFNYNREGTLVCIGKKERNQRERGRSTPERVVHWMPSGRRRKGADYRGTGVEFGWQRSKKRTAHLNNPRTMQEKNAGLRPKPPPDQNENLERKTTGG